MARLLILLLAVSCMAASCPTKLEHARMEIAEDVSSSVQLLMSHRIEKDSAIEKSDELLRYAEQAKACGASTRLFGGTSVGKFLLQINFSAKTRDELDVALQCGTTNDDRFPNIAIETSDGLLGRRYTLDFSQTIPFRLFSGDGTAEEFTFTMPGEITDFSDKSTMTFSTLKTQVLGGNRMQIRFLPLPKAEIESQFERICPGKKCSDEVIKEALKIRLNFRLTATKSKVDLQSIAAIAGVLLGSGLVFEVGRRFAARRRNSGTSN
jgi:hypothetical protein